MIDTTLPQHIGIIIDGNRRRAKQKNLESFQGHLAGAKTLEDIIEIVFKKEIKILTIYGFSTENRKRSTQEVDALMQIFIDYLQKMKIKLTNQPVKVKILWDTSVFSDALKQAILEIEESTKNNTTYQFNLCLNYGGRNDILQGIKSFFWDIQQGIKKTEDINEKNFGNYLYTAGQPDPDLIIRTSGEERLSNFLTRQSAYAELLFIKTLRPDFNEQTLDECLTEFARRKRRYGW